MYFNRLVAPQVPPEQRPPRMKLGSHWHLWSWLIPVFTVSDEELLQLTGLDALVGAGRLQWVPAVVRACMPWWTHAQG